MATGITVQKFTPPPELSYSAPWPPGESPTLCSRIADIAYTIFSVIVFPVGIVRIIHYLFLQYATSKIFPKNYKSSEMKKEINEKREALINDFKGERLTLETPDHVKIDTMIFYGTDRTRALLVPMPMKMSYEELGARYLAWVSRINDVTVLLLNPRGVGESEGCPTPEGLALDVYTGFKYLIDKEKVDPENVCPFLASLAGSYGGEGVVKIQKEYPEKKIWAVFERNFATFALAAEHYLQNKELCCGGFLGSLCGMIMRGVGWNLSTLNAFKQLKGECLVVFHKQDQKVLYSASLHKALDENSEKIETSSSEKLQKRFLTCPETKEKKTFHEYELYEPDGELLGKEELEAIHKRVYYHRETLDIEPFYKQEKKFPSKASLVGVT